MVLTLSLGYSNTRLRWKCLFNSRTTRRLSGLVPSECLGLQYDTDAALCHFFLYFSRVPTLFGGWYSIRKIMNQVSDFSSPHCEMTFLVVVMYQSCRWLHRIILCLLRQRPTGLSFFVCDHLIINYVLYIDRDIAVVWILGNLSTQRCRGDRTQTV